MTASDAGYVNGIIFADGGSGYYGAVGTGGNLGCFRLTLNSSLITQNLRLRRINIAYTSRADLLPGETDPSFVYQFGSQTSMFVRFSPVGAGAPTMPGARLIIDDVDPPAWQGCPLEPVTVLAEKYARGATATWLEPVAADQVSEVVIESTHAPGDYFTIVGSPHRVVYTAFDDSGFSSTCTILVEVGYDRVTWTTYGVLSTEFAQSVAFDPVVRHYTITQNLARQAADGEGTFDNALSSLTVDLGAFTALALTMALPDGRVLVRVHPAARSQVLEVDLTWTLDGEPFVGESNASFSAVPTFGFNDLIMTGDSSRRRRAIDESFGIQPNNELRASGNVFASFQTVVDTDNGVIRLKAVSHPLTQGFTFTGFTITIGYPVGAMGSTTRTYQLTAGSFANIKAAYDNEPDLLESGYFVVLLDTQPPVIHDCPQSFGEVALPGLDYTLARWTEPTVMDNVGILRTVMSRRSGDQFDLLKVDQASEVVTVQTWDYNGNKASCSFTVTVEDAEDPMVTCATDFSRTLAEGAATASVAPAEYAPRNMSDNSPWPVWVVSPVSQLVLEPGAHEVIVTVADNWKRNTYCSVTITVVDAQPPTIVCPTLNAVGANSGAEKAAVVWSAPTTTDNHRVARVEATMASGSDFPVGETMVTLTAVDASGNTASCNFTVTVLAQANMLGSDGDQATPVSIIAGSATAAGVVLVVLIALVVALNRQRRKARAPQNWGEIFSLMEQFASSGSDGDGPIMPREISTSVHLPCRLFLCSSVWSFRYAFVHSRVLRLTPSSSLYRS